MELRFFCHLVCGGLNQERVRERADRCNSCGVGYADATLTAWPKVVGICNK